MKRVLGVLLALALLVPAAAEAEVDRRALSRALANSLYCQLVGCTMTGPILLPDGSVAAPALQRASDLGGILFGATTGAIIFAPDNYARFKSGPSAATSLQIDSAGALAWTSGLVTDTSSSDLTVYRDGANHLAQRNGTNSQKLSIYDTWANAGVDYERFVFDWITTPGTFTMGTEIGGTGVAQNITFKAAGAAQFLFQTNGSDRWIISSAGILRPAVDNALDIGSGAQRVNDLFLAQSVQSATSKTLADAVATEFVEIAIAASGMIGGVIEYAITATDNTDFQSRSGIIPFAVVNKAGTETCTVDSADADEVVAVSVGTLTNAFTCSTTPANAIRLLANANSSLAAPTVTIQYRVHINSGVATITPQ